jgi:hypothetical protein
MTTPKTIKSIKKLYYSIFDILEKYQYLDNCTIKKKARYFIKEYQIDKKYYNYYHQKKNAKKYSLTNKKNSKAELFIMRDYIDNILVPNITSKRIDLSEEEKFTVNNKKHQVDIRGERSYDKIYFKVSDVEKMLNVLNIKNLFNQSDKYKKDIHYKSLKVIKTSKKTSKQRISKRLFFTYRGFILYLFSSHSDNAVTIQDQILKILCSYHYGSKKSKQELIGKMMKMSLNHVREVFTSSGPVSCVYLFTLGKVKDLRESMSIPDNYKDNSIVCKYGYSVSLKRRFKEHQKTYGEIKMVDLRLKYYRYIDTGLLSKAESSLSFYMDKINAKFSYDKYKELIIVSEKDLNDTIKKQYDLVSNAYCVQSKDFVNTIEKIENKMNKMKVDFENKLLKKDNDILKKDNDILKKDNESSLEIAKIKYEANDQKHIYEKEIVKLKSEKEIVKLKSEKDLYLKDLQILKLQLKLKDQE